MTPKPLNPELDDEIVFDAALKALLGKPMTFSELYAAAVHIISDANDEGPMPHLYQVEDALDILLELGTLQIFREVRFGDRMKVYRLNSESRHYYVCKLCKGTGVQDNVKRGLCQYCHGNGVLTPDPMAYWQL